MIKSLLWNEPKPFKNYENVKLPFCFSFITNHINNELCIIGVCCTHINITSTEFKEFNDGFT